MKRFEKRCIFCIGLIFLFLTFFLSVQFTFIDAKSKSLDNSFIANAAGPQIKNIILTPETPEWYDNITINAQVTDPWGILSVKINYDAQKDAYAGWGANFTMTHVADDLYTYTILNSIWNLPYGPAFGSRVNFTIYAKNGLGVWSRTEYHQFYMNDTVKPIVNILNLNNETWVSGMVYINSSIIEEGSGLQRVNLSIFMGNGTLLRRYTSTNLNNTFIWNVSALPDYNISEPASYFALNLTAWDKAIPSNKATVILESIWIDNTPPSIVYINSHKNLTAYCEDNRTLTNNVISATQFENNYTQTQTNDSIYQSFYNGSMGFLQVVYGLNLSSWNLTVDMIYYLSITLEGKIGYSNSSILEAGWKIWNWDDNNFTIIDSSIFNSTEEVSDTIYITNLNKSLYINDNLKNRIEIFFFINTSGPEINASIDYILYNMSYYEIDEWYNRENENITLHIIGFDLLSFDRIELFHVFDENTTQNTYILNVNATQIYYIFNTSGSFYYQFNTTVLPDGLVPLNITVYDKAGNSNSSSILLNVDYLGPFIEILSPAKNAYIGESKIWDLIVPITLKGYDIAKTFHKMELYIDEELAPVRSGQLGQILEYDEFGSIIYEQENATWFEEGTFTYYWNASTLIHGSTHELTIRAYDKSENPSKYSINVTKAIFTTNISLINLGTGYSTKSDIPVLLEFKITNYGNSTLKDFTPQLNIPTNWDWCFIDVDAMQFNYLNPGESITFKIQIIPSSIQNTLNQSIGLLINCTIIENLTQPINTYFIQLGTYLTVSPKSFWENSRIIILLLISIAAGLGIGLFSFYLYLYLQKISRESPKTPEKSKKEK